MISVQEWKVWTRDKVSDIREYGLKRNPIEGYDGLSKVWNGTDEYCSIFSREQVAKGEFDTIFMEVDGHGGGESWKDKLRVVLSKVDFAPSRLYISGRGSHMYWDLDESIVGVGRYKQIVAAMVKKWGIGDLVDMHVVGDVRRVARLPMSKNSKGGYMVRVNAGQLDNGWEVMPGFEPETLTNQVPCKIHLEIGEAKDAPEQHFGPTPQAKRLYSEGEYPPCCRAGIKQLQSTGELDHAQRLHTFSFLVQNDEIGKAFQILKSYAGDFNADISGYQLERMALTGHQPFKCSNVPKDLCPYTNMRECHFYPWITLDRRLRMGAKNDGN